MRTILARLLIALFGCASCHASDPWPSLLNDVDEAKVERLFVFLFAQTSKLKLDEKNLEGGDTSFYIIDDPKLLEGWKVGEKSYLTFLLFSSLSLKRSEITGIAIMLGADRKRVAEKLLSLDRTALLQLFAITDDPALAKLRRAKFYEYAHRLAAEKAEKYPVPK